MIRQTMIVMLLSAGLLSAPALAQTAGAVPAVAACSPTQLSLHTDDGDGRFNGMSHSGTLLVLRNHSASACTIEPFARITLQNKRGTSLDVTIAPQTAFSGPVVNGRRMPMGDGPVALPIAIAPAATVSAELYWVSGAVYDNSVCVEVASVTAHAGSGVLRAPLAAHICGPDAGHLSATLTRLVPYPRAPVSGI